MKYFTIMLFLSILSWIEVCSSQQMVVEPGVTNSMSVYHLVINHSLLGKWNKCATFTWMYSDLCNIDISAIASRLAEIVCIAVAAGSKHILMNILFGQ